MAKRAYCIAASGFLVVVLLGASPWARAGEYRSTLRGQSVVRHASYEQAEAIPEPMPEDLGPITAEPMDSGPIDALPGEMWTEQPDVPHIYMPFPIIRSWAYWGRLDFLLWWRGNEALPPLVTSSTLDTPIEEAGILGNPNTTVMYGAESADNGATAGGRVMIGAWTDCEQTKGIGLRWYGLGTSRSRYNGSSLETPILARPFYNVTVDVSDADVVTYPGETTGAISVELSSRVGGGDFFLRRLFYADPAHRVDLLFGYQMARIDQELRIATTRTVVRDGGSIPFGTVVDSFDLFDTRNTYNAFALGMIGEYDRGPVTWRLLAKVGLGNMHQEALINGATGRTIPGLPTVTTDTGLLAQDTNIGKDSRDVFAVSPEIGINLAYHLSANVDLTAGYSFIYWSRFADAAGQIDLAIDTSGSPVATRPAFTFADSTYLMHGLTLGVQCVY